MRTEEKLREECAVFGVSVTAEDAAGIVYNGLLTLQHRGQEGSGMAVVRGHKILCHKNIGLVSEVFTGEDLKWLSGAKTAVGHNRYSTTGENTRENAGPFVAEYLTGRIATAHNGNITNAREIRERLWEQGLYFDATSDSEVISSLIAFWVMKEADLLKGVVKAARLLRGAFSLVIMSGDDKLIALRDPAGYRPLCLGQSDTGVAVASESCALDGCGFSLIRDVRPGELVLVEKGEITYAKKVLAPASERGGLCIFEYVYFARPDSVIDHASVYETRYNMGAVLAEEYPVAADVVCGVPDSGLEAAIGYSARSGIPLVSGFVKNRYIGRSFIYPTQTQRENAVRLKLNPLSHNIRGKRIILVDDSLVRGTTSEKIVRSLKQAGAKEVHLRISSPPFLYTCHFGTDIGAVENLVANQMSRAEICRDIGADSLGYISIQGLKRACEGCVLPFCTACFTGSNPGVSKR